MKITLLYQVSHYIRVKKTKKYKELGPAKLPRYKRILLYPTSLERGSTVVALLIHTKQSKPVDYPSLLWQKATSDKSEISCKRATCV